MPLDPLMALAADHLPGVLGWRKREMLEACSGPAELESLLLRKGRAVKGSMLRGAERELKVLKRLGIAFVILGEQDYPSALAAIYDPPLLLYYRGVLPPEGGSPVALVGTRKPTGAGLRQAYKLGAEFALSGHPVVSGLAYGIDAAAHEGALAVSAPTWAVLAGGLDRPSPLGNLKLASRILDSAGGLLGEMAPGTFPLRYAFPRRNRILSGLCRGTVVVQAPARSGALITADFALDQGRDLYVGSSGLEGPASAGTSSLEFQGAPVIDGAGEVLLDWGRVSNLRALNPVDGPEDPVAMASLMAAEIEGRILRYKGGCFERG